MTKKYLLVLVFVQLSFVIFGQTTDMNTDKKHKVEIRLSTNTGSIDIEDKYYELNDSIFFIFKPIGDWELKKGDVKDFKTIKIKQSDAFTLPGRITPILNASEDIASLVFAYPRKNIDITNPFEFYFEDYHSGIMGIPEENWDYYSDYTTYYNSSKELYDEKKYIEAFEQLQNILPGADNHFAYTKFSSFNQASGTLMPDIITKYQEDERVKLQGFQSKFNAEEKATAQELAAIKMGRDSIELCKGIFEPYYRITESKNIDLKNSHEKLITDYNELYLVAYNAWRASVLTTVESGFYKKENKFEVFIELITRLLVYKDHVDILTTYDSLDVSLISNPENEIPFFQSRIDILEQMNWRDEFITIVELLNEEIKSNSHLFGQSGLVNLRGIKKYESQPNYDIINAFNELVKDKKEDFKFSINQAIMSCTDKEMLYYLELWYFSYRFYQKDVDQALLDKINDGLEFEKKYLPTDAIKQYEMAGRMGNNSLPPFLIGKIKLENSPFEAERYINDAINIYPGFALARIYYLEMLIENKDFDVALSEIEAVLNYPDLKIWYIYFLKAKILFLQENYNGSLEVINNNCALMNGNNFEQYILLGDIYLALKNCVKAKENYQNAGDLDRGNRKFGDRMRKLVKECNN